MISSRRYFFKYLSLSILSFSIAASQSSVILAQMSSKQAQQQQAEMLNQKGQRLLDQGRAREALESWQQATKLFEKLKDKEGITGTLINQSVALQALGLHLRACKVLVKALKFNPEICSTLPNQPADSTRRLLESEIDKLNPIPVNFLGLQNLGNVLRQLGKLSESELVLRKTLLIGQQLPNFNTSAIFLSLINTEKAIYQQAQERYTWIEEAVFKKETVNFIQTQALKILSNYRSLIDKPSAPIPIRLQAQLHRLSLLLDFEKWLTAESDLGNTQLVSIQTQINQQIKPSVEAILKNSSAFSSLPANQAVHTRIHFATSLNQIPDERLQSLALEYAQLALEVAETTNEQRLMSKAYGTLGKLEKQQQRSLVYLQQAMGLAQSVQAWDIAYEWQHELGLRYYKQGKYQQAEQAYAAAINNLTQIRDNLLASNADLQFSFYEKVEPVYREYMRLLLSSPNPNLNLVIQSNERLQIAELENYLKCGRLDLVALNEINNLNNFPTVIHIIDLGNTVEVIVQSTDRSLHRNSVDAKLIRNHINNLVDGLQDKNLAYANQSVLISHSQALYQQLIAPVKKHLPPLGTLIFTLDASFQSLPMSLLYDGEDYLIEHYSIVGTLGSRVRIPKVLAQKQLRALIAGISKESPSFYAANAPKGLKALPGVEVEITNIKEEIISSKVLLNENFVSLSLDKELNENNFSIIHLTTHAQFSSDPQRTMIFAWDKPITVLDFNNLLKEKTQTDQNAIELLVLSACETAKGNKRSALGMAGVATQTGARSTIATLWQVDADSSALFMKEFYKGLKNGLTKAEALRQAQLQLLSNPQYQHLYHWAPFLLIGSWL